MVKVAAIGGYQAKVTLVEEGDKLRLDGAERADSSWRPAGLEVDDQIVEAFKQRMDAVTPTESALQRRLKEALGQ